MTWAWVHVVPIGGIRVEGIGCIVGGGAPHIAFEHMGCMSMGLEQIACMEPFMHWQEHAA